MIFNTIHSFIQSGRLSEDRPMIICEVMGLADQYGLDALKTLCENILKHSVDHENVCSILKNSDKYQVIVLSIVVSVNSYTIHCRQ